MNRSTEYFDGAAMAYNDVADLIASMAKNLPAELSFAAGGFADIAAGIRKKVETMQFLISEATSQ